MKYKIAVLLLLTTSIYAQSDLATTRDFFPPKIPSLHQSLIQEVDLFLNGEILKNYYEYYYEDNYKRFITKTYDTDGILRSQLIEEVTPEGMLIVGGFIFEYDENKKPNKIKVRVKKVITFPFIKLDQIDNWSAKTTASYGNKVIVSSNMRFVDIATVKNDTTTSQVLYMERDKTTLYTGNYKRKKIKANYIFSFEPVNGVSHFYTKKVTKDVFAGKIIQSTIRTKNNSYFLF